jgi:drug/metabolite transporter (DMT)-like permease
VLAAAVAQAVYHFASKPLLARYTGFQVACYAMWSGTLFLAPLAPLAVRSVAQAGVAPVGAAVFLGLLPSALGFVTWGYALARCTVTATTSALYLVPPVALIIAFCWLHEIPHPADLLGGAISIAGVILISRRGPALPDSPEAASPEAASPGTSEPRTRSTART